MCLLHKHVQTLNYSNLGQDNPATVGSEDECGLSLDPVLNLLNTFYHHFLLSKETVQMDGQVQART